MTQLQVARAVSVDPLVYQQWESGAKKVPKSLVADLARVLDLSEWQVEGRSEPYYLSGDHEDLPDESQYYGELAIHFDSGLAPLLLPITEAERSKLHDAIQSDEAFIQIESLDNRIVFVRRKAIADVYFSSKDYEDYGPGDYGGQHLGVYPTESFWKIVEFLDCPEVLGKEFSDEEIQAVSKEVILDDADLEELIANGSVKPEDRNKVREEADRTTERYVSRSRNITWQLQGNCSRYVLFFKNREVYKTFCLLPMASENELLYLTPENYHRSIFIRLSALDFITIPAHKYHEGELDSLAEDANNTKAYMDADEGEGEGEGEDEDDIEE